MLVDCTHTHYNYVADSRFPFYQFVYVLISRETLVI